MQQRQLGNSGLTTIPLMLGGNVFGWTADRETSFAVLDAFVDGGGTLIDTADMYSNWIPGLSGGESERMIGEWMAARQCRDRVLIATKCGRGAGEVAGLSRTAIEKAIDQSLVRLRTDYVDLYFSHLDDAQVPLAETLNAFDRLVKAGKVRAVGASQYEASRLVEARRLSAELGLASYDVLQPRYNLMNRASFEGALQDACLQHGMAAVPFYGLASGFLTGKYRSEADLHGRQRGAEVARFLTPQGFAVLDALDRVAADLAASAAQVALAWLMAQPAVAAPIASGTSAAQVVELLGATRLELQDGHRALLDAASAPAA